MSYRVSISPAHGFAWVEVYGHLDADGLVGAMHAVYASEHAESLEATLWDSRNVGRFLLDLDGLAKVSRTKTLLADAREGTRAAVLVARDLDAEMAVMLTRYGEVDSRRVGVFRELESAMAFLDRDGFPDDLVVVAEVDSSPPA